MVAICNTSIYVSLDEAKTIKLLGHSTKILNISI